jgi:hypothetical protein
MSIENRRLSPGLISTIPGLWTNSPSNPAGLA